MAKKATIDAARPALNALDQAADTADHVVDVVETAVELGADKVEQGLEVVADVVPETVEKVAEISAKGGHRLVGYFRDPKHAAVLILLLSTSAGAGLGYLGYRLMRKQLRAKLEAEFDERLQAEVAEARAFFARVNKVDEFATPLEALKTLGVSDEEIKAATDALRSYQGETPEVTANANVVENAVREDGSLDIAAVINSGTVEVDGEPIVVEERNIFVDGQPLVDDDWDYDAEIAQRTSDAPYVISFDEFNQNEGDFEQASWTYYEGDDVLANEKDENIDDIEGIVSTSSLGRFGSGSQDENVVYVRNERMRMDFEITRSTGKFAEEVMGFIAHSDRPHQRVRWDDEG